MQHDTTADKFTPGRKLKTYGGRRSRSVNSTPLWRTPSQTTETPSRITSNSTTSKERRSGANNRVTQSAGKGKISRLPKLPSLKAAAATTTTAPPKTPLSKQQGDNDNVFDIPSSEDELQSGGQPWLKRRKLSPLKESRSTERKQKRTANAEKDHAGKHEAKSSPQVEVVIRTPSGDGGGETSSGARRPGARKPADDTSPTLRHKASQVPKDEYTSRQRLSFGDSRELPVRPHVLRTPSRELQRATKHLSAGPESKAPVSERSSRPKSVLRGFGNHGNTAGTPVPSSTPSRKKLVDILGRRDLEQAGESSDSVPSRSGSESPPAVEGRLPAVAAGSGPETGSSSSNPRRSKPAANSLRQSQISGLKTTYARQRSFLNELDAIDAMATLDEGSSFSKPSLSSRETSGLGGASNSMNIPLDDLDEDKSGGKGAIRSIYELRRSGDNARYHAVIETIFEDIEDLEASTSRRRSGLMQLCTKLLDSQFAQRFLNSSFEKRFANSSAYKSDVISACLSISVYGLLLSSGPVTPITLQMFWTQVLRLAPRLLRRDEDVLRVAKLPETKMSKAGKADFVELCEKLRQSKIWTAAQSSPSPPCKVTPQLMALRCLEMTVRKLRETGTPMDPISDTVLHGLIELLLEHSLADDNNDTRGTSLESLLVVELGFSILESYTIDTLSLEEDQQKALKALSRIGPLFSRLERRSDSRSKQIQILEIRLVLNVTNNNPELCREFSTAEFVGPLARMAVAHFRAVGEEGAGTARESVLDTVILALGALINLAEWSSDARRVLLDTTTTITTTTATTTATLMDQLLQLFIDGLEAISEVLPLFI